MLDTGYIYTGNVFDKKHSLYDDVPWWEVHALWLIIGGIVLAIGITVLVVFLVRRRKEFLETPIMVTFYGSGVKKYKYGSYINPDIPEKEGYIFCGWYKDTSFFEPLRSKYKVKRDITLYPKWEKER